MDKPCGLDELIGFTVLSGYSGVPKSCDVHNSYNIDIYPKYSATINCRFAFPLRSARSGGTSMGKPWSTSPSSSHFFAVQEQNYALPEQPQL